MSRKLYCDLYIKLNKKNYRVVLDKLYNYGVEYVGFPIDNLSFKDIEAIYKYGKDLGIKLFKRKNIKNILLKKEENVIYSLNINDIIQIPAHKYGKIRFPLTIHRLEDVSYKVARQVLPRKSLLVEVLYNNLFLTLYDNSTSGKDLPRALYYLKYLAENARLIVSSGTDKVDHILSPKEIILSIMGLFKLRQYTENFVSTLPIKVVKGWL